ncbi:hypothetical protein TWF694_008829 [Orbilia ellipsospora]|uniref:Uncharacterized protein n=1 Tax=Orbilia ellipsospora TaxID=2528407 RepID=A0AAV9XEA5_9PEZI
MGENDASHDASNSGESLPAAGTSHEMALFYECGDGNRKGHFTIPNTYLEHSSTRKLPARCTEEFRFCFSGQGLQATPREPVENLSGVGFAGDCFAELLRGYSAWFSVSFGLNQWLETPPNRSRLARIRLARTRLELSRIGFKEPQIPELGVVCVEPYKAKVMNVMNFTKVIGTFRMRPKISLY